MGSLIPSAQRPTSSPSLTPTRWFPTSYGQKRWRRVSTERPPAICSEMPSAIRKFLFKLCGLSRERSISFPLNLCITKLSKSKTASPQTVPWVYSWSVWRIFMGDDNSNFDVEWSVSPHICNNTSLYSLSAKDFKICLFHDLSGSLHPA